MKEKKLRFPEEQGLRVHGRDERVRGKILNCHIKDPPYVRVNNIIIIFKDEKSKLKKYLFRSWQGLI